MRLGIFCWCVHNFSLSRDVWRGTLTQSSPPLHILTPPKCVIRSPPRLFSITESTKADTAQSPGRKTNHVISNNATEFCLGSYIALGKVAVFVMSREAGSAERERERESGKKISAFVVRVFAFRLVWSVSVIGINSFRHAHYTLNGNENCTWIRKSKTTLKYNSLLTYTLTYKHTEINRQTDIYIHT